VEAPTRARLHRTRRTGRTREPAEQGLEPVGMGYSRAARMIRGLGEAVRQAFQTAS